MRCLQPMRDFPQGTLYLPHLHPCMESTQYPSGWASRRVSRHPGRWEVMSLWYSLNNEHQVYITQSLPFAVLAILTPRPVMCTASIFTCFDISLSQPQIRRSSLQKCTVENASNHFGSRVSFFAVATSQRPTQQNKCHRPMRFLPRPRVQCSADFCHVAQEHGEGIPHPQGAA